MITIPFVIVLIVFAVYQGKWIRKNNVKLYVMFTALSIISFLTRTKIPITEPFTQGYLGLSFLYVVMIAGAIENKSSIRKSILGVRREYSIIGFILISSHSLKYLSEFLLGDIRFEWFGVIPYVIMIPLFITSFMVIRRKLTLSTWKYIQKYAYVVYILIFIHLIVVAELPNLAVYILLFTPYILLKSIKEIKKYKNRNIL